MTDVSQAEIRDILTGLKGSFSKDIYGITVNFIKRNVSLFVPPLTKLVNLTFASGEFPDLLKSARVVPIFKGGEACELGNYRPISILPAFSKVFEKALYKRLMTHIEINKFIYPQQFGFRKGLSTADAVVTYVVDCLNAFEAGEYCISLMLDLSRAFDCVSHRILLEKLSVLYKFNTETLRLLESYLTGRRQRVECSGVLSSELPVDRGVPQGSILGPLLFILFINDLPFCIRDHAQCILYADDATILIHSKDRAVAQQRAESVLELVSKWTTANELLLNESKTVEMLFALRRFDFENPDFAKLLGVYITPPYLTFENHALKIGARVSRNIFVLRRLVSSVSAEVVRMAYFALVHSHIAYCILAWGGTAASSYIFRLQRRAIRVLGGLNYRDDCSHLFGEYNILTVPSMFILDAIVYANDNKHDYRLHGDHHRYETRGRHDIRNDFCRLSKTQRGPKYSAIKLFNKLPADARELHSGLLRKRLRSFLLKKAFYNVDEFLNCDCMI